MVTDTAIIGRVADICVYVCRADVTPKAGYRYINVLRDEHKFPKLATVINDIDMSKRKNTTATVTVLSTVTVRAMDIDMDTVMDTT